MNEELKDNSLPHLLMDNTQGFILKSFNDVPFEIEDQDKTDYIGYKIDAQ